jgi:anti-sigma B factor antagonist
VRISSEIKDSIAIFKISGSMLFDPSLFELREQVRKLLQSNIRRFIIDVSEVPHLDSSGCGEVISTHSSIIKAGGALAFVNPTERIRILWTRIRIIDILNIFDNFEGAQAFVRNFKLS